MASEKIDQVYAVITKYITPALPVLVVLGALSGIVIYIVKAEIESAVGAMRTDIGTMKTQVSGLETGLAKNNDRIDTLLKDALDRAFPRAVASKSDVHASLKQADAIIRFARDQNVKLDSAKVQRVGLDVLELTDFKRPTLSPADWQSMNEMFGYYSIVKPVDPDFVAMMATHSVFYKGTDKSGPCVSAQSGSHNFVFNTWTFENCTLHLSETLERAAIFSNVIFRDVSVIYEGGHVVLDKVAFINCTFQLPITDTGKKFGEVLLAENEITHLELP
jgi:hypothetical protein